jgi:hypothetical protein
MLWGRLERRDDELEDIARCGRMIEKRSCVYICIVRIEYVNNEIRLGFALIHCCII